jgi:hypothetical protein
MARVVAGWWAWRVPWLACLNNAATFIPDLPRVIFLVDKLYLTLATRPSLYVIIWIECGEQDTAPVALARDCTIEIVFRDDKNGTKPYF